MAKLMEGDIRTPDLAGVRVDAALASLVGFGWIGLGMASGSIAFLERHLMGAKV